MPSVHLVFVIWVVKCYKDMGQKITIRKFIIMTGNIDGPIHVMNPNSRETHQVLKVKDLHKAQMTASSLMAMFRVR